MTEASVDWRDAHPSDEPFLRSLWAATFGSTFAMLPEPLASQLCSQQYDMQLAGYRQRLQGCTVHVVQRGAEPVGRVILAAEPARVEIVDLAILPAFQGTGVGSEVIRRVLAEAAGTPVQLWVEHSRPRARALYERLGFVEVETSATHARMEWHG